VNNAEGDQATILPYAVADDGQIVYGPIFSQEDKREVFGSG
jgi:hypothetical protein